MADSETVKVPPRKPKPKQWIIRKNFPDALHPAVVKHPTEKAARDHIVRNHPRGREVFLEHPDGHREHYSADLALQGDEPWQEFTDEDDD
jgi:hypothetical protein